MEQKEIDKTEIEKLRHGQSYVVPESDYGKAEVWKINDTYILFSIPVYGGLPTFHRAFLLHSIDEMLDVVYSWN